MRVLYLTNNIHTTGTARILRSWLTLGQQHDVHGFTVVQSPGPLSDWLTQQQLPWTTSPMPRPGWANILSYSAAIMKLAWWARKHRIDVIHCNEHDVYPFASRIRKLLGIPIVCHVRYRISRDFSQWAFGKTARQPDALLFTSRHQQLVCAAALLGIVPPERQHIVPIGVDPDESKPCEIERTEMRRKISATDSHFVIGTASVIQPRKRIHEFLEVFARCAKRYPNVIAVIAGAPGPEDESYAQRLRLLAKALHVSDRVTWLGRLQQIEPFMNAIDLFISASEYETFGNSVCEAMAAEKPVVAYQGGSVGEVVGDCGIIVETGKVDALADAALRIMQSRDLRQNLGRKARQRVLQNFNPATNFQTLHATYAQLTSHTHLRPHSRQPQNHRRCA